MALNTSGPISIGGSTSGQSVNLQLGRASNATTSLGEVAARNLAGIPSGQISLYDFYGKPSRTNIYITISANTANYNIFSNKGAGYIAGNTDVYVTINSGVFVYSTNVGLYALSTGTGWASGDVVRITNNGSIVGRGGDGGTGGSGAAAATAGGAGGPALYSQVQTFITNNGLIGGGGAGGAGGDVYITSYSDKYGTYYDYWAGGGGGGGAGGGLGGAGGVDWLGYPTYAGVAGQFTTGGTGGSNQYGQVTPPHAGATGGSLGNGAAVSGNSNITWLTAGTRLGAIV